MQRNIWMTPSGTVLLHGKRALHILRLFSEGVRFLHDMKKFSINFQNEVFWAKPIRKHTQIGYVFALGLCSPCPGVLGDWWERDRPKETRHQNVKPTT